MTNELQVFKYDGRQVRTVEKDGETWFIARDVCDALGIVNITRALNPLDNDEKMTFHSMKGHSEKRGGAQLQSIVSLPGLYKLIFNSRKAEAKAFTRWVTHEVLPEIHRHGMYLTDEAFNAMRNDPEAFDRVLKLYEAERAKARRLQNEIDSSRVYTNLGHVVLSLPGSITFQEAANFLYQHGLPYGQNRLYKKGREMGLLCSRRGKQYNRPTQRALELGLFSVDLYDGFHARTMVNPKGLSYFVEDFSREQYPLITLMEMAEEV